MSANNDNAMTRFLFAILQQKNLKDIDWNQVARDPILAQPISNGHAARMRYSRFRTAILGHEKTRRNRPSAPKSRVTKSKKDPKATRDESVKSESAANSPTPQESAETPEPSVPHIKQERSQYGYDSRFTPALTPGPMPPDPNASHPATIQPRLLTPCSDADGFTSSPALVSSPASEMVNSQDSFDYHGLPYHHTYVAAAWPNGSPSSYPGYDASFHPQDQTINPYNLQYYHPLPHHDVSHPSPTIEQEESYAPVKHEDLDYGQ